MNALSPRLHALLSYGLLLAAVAAVYWVSLRNPLAHRAIFFQALAEDRTRYARFQDAIAHDARLAEDFALTQGSDIDPERFLHADTEALAAAQLQDRLSRVADAAGCGVIGARSENAAEDLLFPPVPVNVELACSVTALTDLLYRLEHARPDLLADNLYIQRGHPSGHGTAESPDELSVRLDVTGFLYREEPR